MKLPCELVIRELLPAFRSRLAKKLVGYGLSQIEVAKLLGITQASVSHYLHSKRGARTRFELGWLEPLVAEIAHRIHSGKLHYHEALKLFCSFCIELRSERLFCQLHKSHAPRLNIEECQVCQ